MPNTTATSGTSLWTRKSDVDSPIPVVNALTIQKIAVTSGTLEKPLPGPQGEESFETPRGGDDHALS
jgi:hypothetical protein